MLKEFKNLSPDEQHLFFDAIPLITILVAGADGDIDEVELEEAQRLSYVRSFNNAGRLPAFYEQVEENLSARIKELIQELPQDVAPRQEEISGRLARFNEIFPKMALPFAYLYYRDFVSFAKHVAESHGGFMRFMTVGPDEAKVMDLPMLTPVERPSKVDYPDLP